jgi:adenylate cyclase
MADSMQVAKLLDQLKERHLYRVAVIYAAAAWLVLQIADIVGESFDWPDWLMQGLILVLVLGLPLVLLFFWFSGGSEPAAEAMSDNAVGKETGGKPSLLVLPFDCFSDEAADVWNASALTEDLTTLIARFSDYSVVARNTAFAYKGRSIDVRSLKEELGVRYVLEGSLRRQADKLRITAQLVETDTGAHLWAENYDSKVEDYDELYDELCRAIVMKLGNELTRAEMHLSQSRPPSDWGVWDLYQQAKGVLQFEGWSQQSFARVADLLRQAVSKDPEFAPAQAYLSLMLALGYWTRLYPDREATYAESISVGEQAMALAPESSEVLGFAGCALSDLGLHDRGIPILERAIELNPSNSQAFAALGVARILSGDMEEGIRHLRHAMDISPFDPGLAPWSTMLSFTETFVGNEEGGLLRAQRACKADPRYFGGYLAQAMAQIRLDRPDEARRSLEEAKRLNPDLSDKSASALIGEQAWQELGKAGITLPDPA